MGVFGGLLEALGPCVEDLGIEVANGGLPATAVGPATLEHPRAFCAGIDLAPVAFGALAALEPLALVLLPLEVGLQEGISSRRMSSRICMEILVFLEGSALRALMPAA
jgi:hypothetical protein